MEQARDEDVVNAQHRLHFSQPLLIRVLTNQLNSPPMMHKHFTKAKTLDGGVIVGVLRHFAYTLACSAAAISAAAAAELPVERAPAAWRMLSPQPIAQWESEIGGRYWYSNGRTKKDLFSIDNSGTEISQLTYSSLQAHSGEIFGRVDHLSGFFVKGFIGGGAIPTGNLRDQDFPPFTFPFSSTSSDQRDGRLGYANFDLGWGWRGGAGKFGFFAGYSYYHERLNAYGCTQTGLNAGCVPPIPTTTLGITQDTTWNAVRLGVNGEWRFMPGWRLSGDLAWIPWASLSATDTHWLRSDIGGPTAETGSNFFSVQAEAFLSYQFLNGFSVGVGGRYWRFRTDGAHRDFQGFDQNITVLTERWGGFLQASYKLGELLPTRYNP